MGTRFNHACAMRRVLEFARCTQVGIRSLSTEEAEAAPTLPTDIFFDVNMRQDANWIDRVVESLGETVYITIDCDGMDPAIMPAVGTPEPGGLVGTRCWRCCAPSFPRGAWWDATWWSCARFPGWSRRTFCARS